MSLRLQSFPAYLSVAAGRQHAVATVARVGGTFRGKSASGVANWIPTTPQTGDRTNKRDGVYQQKWRDQLQTWCILDLLGKSMRT